MTKYTKTELIQMGLFAIFILPIVLAIVTVCCPIIGIVAFVMAIPAKSKKSCATTKTANVPYELFMRDINQSVNHIESNIMNIDMLYDAHHGSEQPKVRDAIHSEYKNAQEEIDKIKKIIKTIHRATLLSE